MAINLWLKSLVIIAMLTLGVVAQTQPAKRKQPVPPPAAEEFTPGNGIAQVKCVKFAFEVDAKPVKEKLKILLYLDGKSVEPRMCDDGFIVPAEVEGRENVGVRFLSKNYDLYFDPIYVKDFKTDWTVGVDNPPFEKENTNPERNYENIALIRYIKFEPKDGDGFMTTVEVKKNVKPRD